MTKYHTTKPKVPLEAAQLKSAPAPKSRLSTQTRKVLQKHYRTKYGVGGRGGR